MRITRVLYKEIYKQIDIYSRFNPSPLSIEKFLNFGIYHCKHLQVANFHLFFLQMYRQRRMRDHLIHISTQRAACTPRQHHERVALAAQEVAYNSFGGACAKLVRT